MSSTRAVNALTPENINVQTSNILVCSDTNLQQQSRRTSNDEISSGQQKVPFSRSLPADPSPNQKL